MATRPPRIMPTPDAQANPSLQLLLCALWVLRCEAPPRSRPRRKRGAPNKANPGRGGLGIDEGLLIIDDLGQEPPGAGMRAAGVDRMPNKPNHSICSSSNSAGHYISKSRRGERKQSQSGRPGAAIGDCRLGIRGARPERPVWTEHQTNPICHFCLRRRGVFFAWWVWLAVYRMDGRDGLAKERPFERGCRE
jgi:hypothetical protein